MTAGYSGTPLAKKLGIKEGMTVVAVDAPKNYGELLDPLPDGIVLISLDSGRSAENHPVGETPTPLLRKEGSQKADILHFFTNSRDDLFNGISKFKTAIKQDGTIWVSWYKKAAKLPTEITEDTIREAAFPLGLVDVKVCAVDEKWSGLKLVIRRENRVSSL